MLLGCIADDFTGASDLANTLTAGGMRTVQTIGVPPEGAASDADAVVVALKSRSIDAADAVAQSLAALRWLRAQGVRQVLFKYCSTFDSTPAGNIGPVAQALMAELAQQTAAPITDFAIVTPAFPENGRTVFKGHLFVGDMLLSDSPMRHHPLTPMTDANLVRVMQAQTKRKVGLIDYKTVALGEAVIRERIAALRADGVGVAVVDATSNDDLHLLGPALKGMPLVTAGSGVAIGLPANFGLKPSLQASQLPAASGLQAVVSGSCSVATNAQVANFKTTGRPAMAINPAALMNGQSEAVVQQVLAWAAPLLKDGPVLVYSTAEPDAVKAVQAQLGVAEAGALVEHALASVARGLVDLGVQQLVVAGGETSGACVQALGIAQLQIGPQIDPGVPWCHAPSSSGGVHITLKSGNFGTEDFFTKAFTVLA